MNASREDSLIGGSN